MRCVDFLFLKKEIYHTKFFLENYIIKKIVEIHLRFFNFTKRFFIG